jgi:hypothetical protein
MSRFVNLPTKAKLYLCTLACCWHKKEGVLDDCGYFSNPWLYGTRRTPEGYDVVDCGGWKDIAISDIALLMLKRKYK